MGHLLPLLLFKNISRSHQLPGEIDFLVDYRLTLSLRRVFRAKLDPINRVEMNRRRLCLFRWDFQAFFQNDSPMMHHHYRNILVPFRQSQNRFDSRFAWSAWRSSMNAYTFASHEKILSRLFCTRCLWLKDKLNDWTDINSSRNSEESSSTSHRFQMFLSLDYSPLSLFPTYVYIYTFTYTHRVSISLSFSL